MGVQVNNRSHDLGCVAPETGSGHPPSQLFTVRLWPEELGNGQVEWRGSVQHVTSGQRRYFREWPALVAAIQAMLAGCEGNAQSAGPLDAQ
jgi:hypothetical protein